MKIKDIKRISPIRNIQTKSWQRTRDLIWTSTKRESQVRPKAEAGLRIILKQQKHQYNHWIIDQLIKYGHTSILKGFDAYFAKSHSTIERDAILGLKALTIDQLYAKGFTYGFDTNHVIDSGIISLANDDIDFSKVWKQTFTDDKVNLIKENLSTKVGRFGMVASKIVPPVDLIKALYRLPNNSRAGYPVRLNWSRMMAISDLSQLGGRIHLTDTLVIDIPQMVKTATGSTLEENSWNDFVAKVRSELHQYGITHEQLILEGPDKNYDKLSLKTIVAYWLLITKNHKQLLLKALSEMKLIVSEFGNRYQGKFDKENLYNNVNITKVRTFIMFQLIMLITSSWIRDYIQDENAANDPQHILWRPTFDKDLNEYIVSQYNTLRSIVGKRLTQHNVRKIDLVQEKTLPYYSKEQQSFLRNRVSEVTLISADYSKFDRHVPVELQAFIFREYAKIFSRFEYTDPDDKAFIVNVLTKQAELMENGFSVIIPNGYDTESMNASIKSNDMIDLALLHLQSLLPSGMAFTSQMGSDISNADMIYLSSLLKLKSYELLGLVTLGDDVLYVIPTYLWTRILPKVNHRTISEWFEKRLLDYRHAEMNADKAVSTYNVGIILQTLVTPYKGIYGYYIPIRVNNSFCPERYQNRVKGIKNYAAMQSISLIMQWMNLYRGSGLNDELYNTTIRMPLLRNRFMKAELNLLKLIKYLRKFQRQQNSNHYWFFELIKLAGGVEKTSDYFTKVNKYLAHGYELKLTDILTSLSTGVIEYEPLFKVIDNLTQLSDEVSFSDSEVEEIRSIYGVDDSAQVTSNVETIEYID